MTSALESQTPNLAPPQTAVPTPLPPLPKVVLLAPEGSDADLAEDLEATLIELAAETGLRFERISGMDPLSAEPADIGVVVPPSLEFASRLEVVETLWVAVGMTGLPEHPSLSVIGENGFRPDRQAFLAGYMSAILSAPNWRTGMLVGADDPAAAAVRTGYENGVSYYCGLCRPIYPPYLAFPQLLSVQAPNDPAAVQQAARTLLDQSVEVAFVRNASQFSAAIEVLAASGVTLITDRQLPEGARGQAAAAILPDPSAALRLIWPDLLGGTAGHRLEMPLRLASVNPAWITPGKQREIDAFLAELLAGFIDTGVDPAGQETN